jgi:hypothetical protein
MAERPALQLVPPAEPERPEEVTEVVTLGDVFEDLRFHLADAARTGQWNSLDLHLACLAEQYRGVALADLR